MDRQGDLAAKTIQATVVALLGLNNSPDLPDSKKRRPLTLQPETFAFEMAENTLGYP